MWNRRTLFVVVFPVVAVVIGSTAMISSFSRHREAMMAVLESTAVIGQVNELLQLATDAETGERGFAITESREFLEPYNAALRRFDASATELERLLAGNAPQLLRARRLHDIFHDWRRMIEQQVILPVYGGSGSLSAREFIRSGEGKRVFDTLRSVAGELVSEQQRQLALEQEASRRAERIASLGAVGAIASILLSVIATSVWSLHFVRQVGRMANVAHALAVGDLSRRVDKRSTRELKALATSMNVLAERLEARTNEAVVLDQLRSALQACQGRDEAGRILERIAPHIFPIGAGALYLINASREQLVREVWWRHATGERFGLDGCWALRRGQPYFYRGSGGATLPCMHHGAESATSLCVPLSAGSDTLGILHVELPNGTETQDPSVRQALLVAETLALSLANLNLRETLRNQAIRDELTGLHNRRYMEETLARELARATRAAATLSIIMFDVDHFKTYNDTYGHGGGDALLRALGGLAEQSFRKSDVVCRYGGEEFVVVMPDASLADAVIRADALRLRVKALVVDLHGKPLGSVSISLGVAVFPRDGQDGDTLRAAADKALYVSKRSGRNRVTVASAEPEPLPPERHG